MTSAFVTRLVYRSAERIDASEENGVALLHVAFQEGFEGDDVAIAVDGKEVHRDENLTTRLQIGRAGSIDVPVERGLHELEVVLPKREIAKRFSVQVEERAYVAISLEGNELTHKLSGEPFRYA